MSDFLERGVAETRQAGFTDDAVGSASRPGQCSAERRQRASQESDVWVRRRHLDPDGGQLSTSARPLDCRTRRRTLAWWDIRQYVEDYTSGNVGLGRIFSGLVYSMYYNLSQAGIGLGRPMRWLYDKLHPLWRGTLFPRKSGTIPDGQPTPTEAAQSATRRTCARKAARGDSSNADHRKQESGYVLGCRNGSVLRPDVPGAQARHADHR